MKRFLIVGLGFSILFAGPSIYTIYAQKAAPLMLAAGSTGSVYSSLGIGMADLISKHLPEAGAEAEVTKGSVENCLRVGNGKADLALAIADVAWEAHQGKGRRFQKKIPLRTVALLYPVFMHLATLEERAVGKVADLKGKRVSTGAPGSWTEMTSLRIVEASGLNPERDVVREKMGPYESAVALKEKKIDAFFWGGDLPNLTILELASSPGYRVKLIGQGEVVPTLTERFGPVYSKGMIPANTYPGQEAPLLVLISWNLLVCHEHSPENRVYQITKKLIEHQQELEKVQKEARFLTLQTQSSGGSPIPFHPGAIRYFSEKGLTIK